MMVLISGKQVLVDKFVWDIIGHLGWYYHRSSGYIVTKSFGKFKPMHRLILMSPDEAYTDHKNRERLDNRFSNLRLCSVAENCYNHNTQRNNSTGYKGVVYHKKNKNFMVRVGSQRIGPTYIGSFKTAKSAARAYNKAAKKKYGIFASLNKL
jgi:hypothetical protein